MSELAELYQQVILDASRRRHGEGELDPFDCEHFEKNPSCGDELRVRLRLSGTGEDAVIDEIGWVGDGCSISMASTSIAVDQLRGRSVAEAREAIAAMRDMMRSRGKLSYDEDSREAELLGDAVAFEGTAKYVMRVKCAMLAWVAVEAALQDHLSQ
ncbi:Fe-S cluster assembly sulfur transfer protein SufU [uncultured Gulosibacter sp.]|uniref:Fe-S cluster assembly sulfur transfer protein SufU n=1 Tax=uncultured Gulosibacter sp. TaxID=1339167 RepID=UPI00288C0E6C|nr:SUF system NifU family Fe-S cluster assembly protein [uncultured Gulosibacter sp.]